MPKKLSSKPAKSRVLSTHNLTMEALTELENLRREIIRVHVVAAAADEALAGLPRLPAPHVHAGDTLFTLVELTAQLAREAFDKAGETMQRLESAFKKGRAQ
jgi:hypothetical protein